MRLHGVTTRRGPMGRSPQRTWLEVTCGQREGSMEAGPAGDSDLPGGQWGHFRRYAHSAPPHSVRVSRKPWEMLIQYMLIQRVLVAENIVSFDFLPLPFQIPWPLCLGWDIGTGLWMKQPRRSHSVTLPPAPLTLCAWQ